MVGPAVGQSKRKQEIGGSIPGAYQTLGERKRHGPSPCTAPLGGGSSGDRALTEWLVKWLDSLSASKRSVDRFPGRTKPLGERLRHGLNPSNPGAQLERVAAAELSPGSRGQGRERRPTGGTLAHYWSG